MGNCASGSSEGDSYYVTIDGVKCDRGIIEAGETAVKAKGDGRVSKRRCRVVAKRLWRVEEVFAWHSRAKLFEVFWVCGCLGLKVFGFVGFYVCAFVAFVC